jgi:hypothetical protein
MCRADMRRSAAFPAPPPRRLVALRAARFGFFGSILALALAVGAAGCGAPGADFATKYAPDLRRDGMTVSVFGVYKDGRMNAESWADVSPRFAAALGGRPCDSLQTDALIVNDRDVSVALDDATRSDGVSDELLDVFAPAASGDAIMLVTIAGHPPNAMPMIQSPGAQPGSFSQPGKAGRSINSTRADPSISAGPATHQSYDVFEVSATLFSVKDHHTVALVAMSYTGKSVDEAMASFVAKLKTELPGMQCKGWKADAKVDADRLRAVRQ